MAEYTYYVEFKLSSPLLIEEVKRSMQTLLRRYQTEHDSSSPGPYRLTALKDRYTAEGYWYLFLLDYVSYEAGRDSTDNPAGIQFLEKLRELADDVIVREFDVVKRLER